MNKSSLHGYMEFSSVISEQIDASSRELLAAAEDSQIHTFGWPIGVVLPNKPFAPVPTADGIRAEISTGESYDAWELKKDGAYYILSSLFENKRDPKRIFLDTRVIRTAETFFRTARLYKRLGISDSAQIRMVIEYGGLNNRILSVASPRRIMVMQPKSSVDTVQKKTAALLSTMLDPAGLKQLTYVVVKELAEKFDFFEVDKVGFVDQIIDTFLAGRID